MSNGPKFTPHPLSAPGDFYVVNGECVTCGMPHVAAPDLMDWADDKQSHCIWRKQPQNSAELARAVAVIETQDFGCHRYAGRDPAILDRLLSTYCDYPLVRSSASQTEAASPRFSLLETAGFLGRIWKKLKRN